MRRSVFLAAAAAVSLTVPVSAFAQADAPASAAPATPPAPAPIPASPNLVASGNMTTTLAASGHFTILTKALNATNLSGVLATTPGLTLFAPTDEAFNALPPSQLEALLAPKNVPMLQRVLTYHLVHLDLMSAKFKGAKGPVASVETGNLVIDGSGPTLKVNDADIIQTDVRASNGVIQVVDKVLIPADVTLPAATASAGAGALAGR